MPVRYLPPIVLPKPMFVNPTPEPSFIWWLFRGLCIMCKHPADEINEIIPRGRGKNSILDWENRVLLCHKCHHGDKMKDERGFHHHGVNDKRIAEMQEKRLEFLKTMGREEYIKVELPIDPYFENESLATEAAIILG